MFRAFVCSAFTPSPPRTFSDSVGFTPALAPLGTVYQRTTVDSVLCSAEERFAHHRPAPSSAQDLLASQSPFRIRKSRLGTLPGYVSTRRPDHHSLSIGREGELSSRRTSGMTHTGVPFASTFSPRHVRLVCSVRRRMRPERGSGRADFATQTDFRSTILGSDHKRAQSHSKA